jgi:chaperone modulatory protein CbpM
MSMQPKQAHLPGRSQYLVRTEFMELTGIHPTRIGELIEMGWIETHRAGGSGETEFLFREVDIYRVRKLERICADFELSVLGGVIVVDLLDRIDALEKKVRELNGLLGRR